MKKALPFVVAALVFGGIAYARPNINRLLQFFLSGTAAAPSIAFTADSDTGLYSSSANVLGISAGGSAAATIALGTATLAKTSGANLLASDTTATAMTASVPAIRVGPATATTPDTNDMLFEVMWGSTSVFSVDKEGDVTAAGSFSFSPADITMSGGDLTSSHATQTFNIVSATNAATCTSSAAAITLAPSDTLNAQDAVVNILSVSGGSSVWKVDLEGDTTTLGNPTFAGGTLASSSTATALYTSATSAANCSSSVGAFTLAPTATLDANDLVLDVKAVNAGGTVASVDKEGDLAIAGRLSSTVQTITISDSGDGNAGAGTLTPSSNMVICVCNDTDGCAVTLSETGAAAGSVVRITNSSANACTFADTGGLTETASSFSMGQWDTLTLGYFSNTWVELGRSNN